MFWHSRPDAINLKTSHWHRNEQENFTSERDELCICWFRSGFCLRFQLTYFRLLRSTATLWDLSALYRLLTATLCPTRLIFFQLIKLYSFLSWICSSMVNEREKKLIRKLFMVDFQMRIMGAWNALREFFLCQKNAALACWRSPTLFYVSSLRKWKQLAGSIVDDITCWRQFSVSFKHSTTLVITCLTPLLIQFSLKTAWRRPFQDVQQKGVEFTVAICETSVKWTLWNGNCDCTLQQKQFIIALWQECFANHHYSAAKVRRKRFLLNRIIYGKNAMKKAFLLIRI